MAGRPRYRAMVAELERRAEDADVSVLDYACDWIGSGKTILQLAKEMSQAVNKSDDYVSRYMLSSYLNKLPEGPERLEEARRDYGASSLADESLEVIDEEVSSKEEVTRNRQRADHRLKLAGFWNRQEYGESKQPGLNVNLNFGDLHLEALRHRALPPADDVPRLPSGAPDTEDVAMVEGE